MYFLVDFLIELDELGITDVAFLFIADVAVDYFVEDLVRGQGVVVLQDYYDFLLRLLAQRDCFRVFWVV
jgi:hypothetical protein